MGPHRVTDATDQRPTPAVKPDVQVRLSPALRAAFALTLLAILGTAILAYWTTWRLFDQGRWVAHTQRIRATLTGLLSALEDGETGERGFVITGDETFLDPYLAAQRDVPEQLRELRDLVGDNPDQARRVTEMQPHIEAQLSELRDAIEVRQRQGFEAAQALVREGRGKREMDAARIAIASMQASEDTFLETQERAARHTSWTAAATFAIAAVLAATLMSLLYATLRRHLREREHLLTLEHALRVTAEEAVAQQQRVEGESERLLVEAQQARAEAEVASRAKDTFLAIVSHELRTPLSPILAWTALLERGTLDAEQTHKALDTILRCARAQAQLIGDLLDVSRIIAGKMRLDVRPVELRAVIEAAVDVVRPAADAKHVRLQLVLDTEIAPIAGDPDRLQQVVGNLLTNAVKFTPKNGLVSLVARVNSHVEIAVSDTGQGIDPTFLPHVFNRFQQADASTTRKYGGLGLGLAIVRYIVEAHGGTVHAESPGPGQGSVFTVKLPLVPVQRKAGETVRRHTSEGRLTAPGDFPALIDLRVLVVDDEPDSNDVVRTILVDRGAEVRVAASASQALDILDRWKPDALITDIGMPGEDGYALLAKVRARKDDMGRLPAIALTAYASADDRVRLLSAGFAMHVAKPIEPVELLAVVASVAERA
jgi:signal transduction histidine kinase